MFRCITLSKKTLETIIGTGNNYVIQVKANTSKLFKEVKEITSTNKVIDSSLSIEPTNGRIDHRLIEIYSVLPDQITGDWSQYSIKTVVKVCRWDSTSTPEKREVRKSKNRKNKATNGIHYYILNKDIINAQWIGAMIRNHWKIENGLHWIKDVHLKEDHMTITDQSAAALVAGLNNIALNQIRKAGEKPCKSFFEKIKNNITWINEIIRT